MALNDREIWNDILAGSTASRELKYLTYAISSFERFEWYDEVEKRKGHPPSQQEIEQWISQITRIRIEAWRETAVRTFDRAAREHLAQNQQDLKDGHVIKAVEDRIGSLEGLLNAGLIEIRQASSFWAALRISLITAILTPVILGLVIVSIRASDYWPTPTQIEKFFRRDAPVEQPASPSK